jgi:hypothetical protein
MCFTIHMLLCLWFTYFRANSRRLTLEVSVLGSNSIVYPFQARGAYYYDPHERGVLNSRIERGRA